MRLSRSGTGVQKCVDTEDISAPLARFPRVCSQMGYGSRALHLLQMYYEGRFPCLEEKVLETSQEIHTVSSEVSVFWPGSWLLAETRFLSGSSGSSSRAVSWSGLPWATAAELLSGFGDASLSPANTETEALGSASSASSGDMLSLSPLNRGSGAGPSSLGLHKPPGDADALLSLKP